MATIITNVTALQAMENDLTADYELGNDINASATSGWNGGLGFDPVGASGSEFTGSFDGKGFTITDLFINRPAETLVGLFGLTGNGCGTIQDVGLVDCNITGQQFVGALIGQQDDVGGAVEDCYSTGSIASSDTSAGGLIGVSYGTLVDCYSTCSVTIAGGASDISEAGGLVGLLARSALRCYATGDVTVTTTGDINAVGGLVGQHVGYDLAIEKCYSTGAVSISAAGAWYTAGFVGEQYSGDVLNCYSRSSVTATGSVDVGGIAGFVGYLDTSRTITDSYSTGLITITGSSQLIGGFAGDSRGTITDCFWDTQTSGQATSDGGTGKITSQMKTESTFTDAGWDFTTIWAIEAVTNNGYPALTAVGTAPTVTTQAVSSIAATTATGNGNITDLGSPDPLAHGVCYNTTGSPTVDDDKTDEGAASSTGAFTSSMTSLPINTKYYAKAYASNAVGTGYGSEVTFTTLGVPTVITQTCEDVVGATATGRGNITVIGNPTPTAHGHCWNTSVNPTTSDSSVDNGAATATGTFTSAITSLIPGTAYYTRAFATNTQGTVYGANVYFIAATARAGFTWDEGSNLRSFDQNAIERRYIHTADVDDTPVNGATTDPISSNWAFDHVAAADPHTGYVLESLFDAQTILQATSDDTPVALTVTEQTLVGRLTGENISAVTMGIADNNIAQIDGTSNAPANLDYAKFTTSGLEGKSYQELVNDISGVIKATDVEVSELSAATYDDTQDYINFFGDRTILSGGDITDNGDGTIAVASGTAWVKATDSDTALGKFFDFSANNSVSLTNLATNYIYIDYNDGTPQMVVATSIQTHGFKQDHILVGTAFRDGTTSHFHHVDTVGIGRMGRVDMHHREEEAVHRVEGMVTSSVGTRNLGITAGVLYEGISRHDTSPFTTPNSGTADDTEANTLHDADGGFAATDVGKTVHNTTDDTYADVTAFVDSGQLTLNADIFISGENYDLDSFTYWYTTDSGSTWTEVRGATQISNSQYNDITSGLSNLTANRYGVHWVYMEVDGEHFHALYGQGDYKANQAEEATPPSISPNIVTQYCALIAKIIVQEGTDTLIIMFPWTTVFTSSFATDHNSLANLTTGDVHTQYFLVAGETTDAKLYSGADFTVYSDAGSTVKTHIDGATGHIGIATSAVTGTGITYFETLPVITDNSPRKGVDLFLEAHKTSAAYTGHFTGNNYAIEVSGSNTQDWTNPIGVRGVYGYVGTGSVSK